MRTSKRFWASVLVQMNGSRVGVEDLDFQDPVLLFCGLHLVSSSSGWGAGGRGGVPFVVLLGADVKEMERGGYLWTALDGDDWLVLE